MPAAREMVRKASLADMPLLLKSLPDFRTYQVVASARCVATATMHSAKPMRMATTAKRCNRSVGPC